MRSGRLAALPVMLAILIALVALPARAQTSNTDKKNQLEAQIDEVSEDQAAAAQMLQEIRARKAPIDARVAQLDAQLAELAAKIAPLEAESARLATVIQDAESKLSATQTELDATTAEVRGSAADIYRSARRGATYEYLNTAQPMDLVHGAQYLDTVNRRQRAALRRIAALRDEVVAQRHALQTSKDQADAATAEAHATRDQIATMRAEVEPARAEAAEQARAEEAQVAALAAKKSQYEREMQAVSEAIAAEIRRAQQGSPPPSSGAAGSCDARPAAGPLASGYGSRTNPIGGGTGFHAGVDIAAPMGAPIYACWAGRVTIASWQGGYGNAVVIDHGGSKATLYGHQSRMAVTPGQTVAAGQIIGYVGSTGNSTGPHLHFEVRINGNPVNPIPYL